MKKGLPRLGSSYSSYSIPFIRSRLNVSSPSHSFSCYMRQGRAGG